MISRENSFYFITMFARSLGEFRISTFLEYTHARRGVVVSLVTCSSTFWKNVAAVGYRQHAAKCQHGSPYHCSPLLSLLLQIKPTAIHPSSLYDHLHVSFHLFKNEGNSVTRVK